MAASSDVLQGTLDLLILRALAFEAIHGWGVAQRIHQLSKSALQINQGSLYPALHRLERRGLVIAEWRASDNNRRAKYYRLTDAGKEQLSVERLEWRRFVAAVDLVLAGE